MALYLKQDAGKEMADVQSQNSNTVLGLQKRIPNRRHLQACRLLFLSMLQPPSRGSGAEESLFCLIVYSASAICKRSKQLCCGSREAKQLLDLGQAAERHRTDSRHSGIMQMAHSLSNEPGCASTLSDCLTSVAGIRMSDPTPALSIDACQVILRWQVSIPKVPHKKALC